LTAWLQDLSEKHADLTKSVNSPSEQEWRTKLSEAENQIVVLRGVRQTLFQDRERIQGELNALQNDKGLTEKLVQVLCFILCV